MARAWKAEVRDILRDAAKDEHPSGEGLGTRIAAWFRGIGLRPEEEIPEFRGFTIKNPFEE